MRFLTCFQYRDSEGNIKKESKVFDEKEVLTVNQGVQKILKKLHDDYKTPMHFIDRQEDESNLVGVFYIRPKKAHELDSTETMDISKLDIYT